MKSIVNPFPKNPSPDTDADKLVEAMFGQVD